MASLKDRIGKESKSPTERAVINLTGKVKGKKYPVNVIFDQDIEPEIRARAAELGIGVATYIKMLVHQDLHREA